HCLHAPRFNRKSSLLQCLFGENGLSLVFKQRTVHHVNIHVSLFGMTKCVRQSTDDFKTELLPQTKRGFVTRYNEIELHRAKTEDRVHMCRPLQPLHEKFSRSHRYRSQLPCESSSPPNRSQRKVVTKRKPRGESGKFLLCTPWTVGRSREILYRSPHIIE